jgi:hypothetical protein
MKISSTNHLLVLGICILGFGLFHMAVGSVPQKDDSPKENPSAVQIGVMSEKQREHSKLYKNYDSGRNIPGMVALEKGDNVEVFRLLPMGVGLSNAPVPTAGEELTRITCVADVVVVGEVRNKSSQLTENLSFVFTDYEMTVRDVLKNGLSTPIQSGMEIIVTRPGGEILLNNKVVRALDESFPPLKTGKKYLLFLRTIPQTGAFQTIESGDSFELEKEKIINLKQGSLHQLIVEYNSSSLLEGIRQTAFYRCE